MTHYKPEPGEDLGAAQQGSKQTGSNQRDAQTTPVTVEAAKPSENIALQPPKNEQKLVDFGSDQSFPASDPPAHDIIKVKESDAGNSASE